MAREYGNPIRGAAILATSLVSASVVRRILHDA
jgi:hypothetical protein